MPKTKRSVTGRGVSIPPARRTAARALARMLKRDLRVALITHVNADGDGCGSEVGLWHLLAARGIRVAITNPTPYPERYRFLLRGVEHADKTSQALKHVERADAIIVLDISDLGRLGQLGPAVAAAGVPVACIDHHMTDGSLPPGPRLVDAKACATGELIYDLARSLGWPLRPDAARALYVAMMTDTGGFRFSNTSPRCLQVAAHLLQHGVDPEQVYTEVYATSSEGRIRLLAEVLDTLVVEPDRGISWVTVPVGAMDRYGVDAEDLEGVVEFARSVRGTRLALLFRQLANGRIKVSFRSVGEVDVARLAAQFGGGGHRKAAGASLEGTLAAVQSTVLDAARTFVAANGEK
ncbi:MAG: bifunctional oligoribonuclease/PAP phosphatase NrnA [Gemmatimonadetes bacterium]|nr:bifunctional oligoribonuclease/PAP phosphatase NrnA [Gemmatimonadota bacterium]